MYGTPSHYCNIMDEIVLFLLSSGVYLTFNFICFYLVIKLAWLKLINATMLSILFFLCLLIFWYSCIPPIQYEIDLCCGNPIRRILLRFRWVRDFVNSRYSNPERDDDDQPVEIRIPESTRRLLHEEPDDGYGLEIKLRGLASVQSDEADEEEECDQEIAEGQHKYAKEAICKISIYGIGKEWLSKQPSGNVQILAWLDTPRSDVPINNVEEATDQRLLEQPTTSAEINSQKFSEPPLTHSEVSSWHPLLGKSSSAISGSQ